MIAKRVLLAATVAALAGFSTPAAAQIRDHVMRLGTTLPDAHPITQAAKYFGEQLEAKTGKKMQVRVYGAAALGNEVQMQSALQGGASLDFSIGTTTTLAGMIKEFSVLDLPYMFRSVAEADALLDGAVGSELFEKLRTRQIHGLVYMEQGFRHTTNSKLAITKWEDFKGLKIRVQPSALYVDMFNGLGSNAVPMTINEVYTAMETRAIDGHENSLTAIDANKFQEVQKFLSLTSHSYNAVALLMAPKTWDKLNADERKAVTEAAVAARQFQRELSRKANDGLLDKLKKDGMQVNDVTLDERKRMGERLQPVVEKHSAAMGAEWMGKVNGELAKIRASN